MLLKIPREDIVVPGFSFAGVACGLKDKGRKDVALIVADAPASAAGAFTTNRFAAPPVQIGRQRLRSGRVQAVLVNTKSANAGTGAAGLARANQCCKLVAQLLGISERSVVPSSTGKIGLPLSWSKISKGIREAAKTLSPDNLWDAAEAIRTTDAFPKVAVRRLTLDGKRVTVAGLAKGAGMIHPQMATTLCYVLTDAVCSPAVLRKVLRFGLAGSFNAISVDGDTSTNDTALLLASGASGAEVSSRSPAKFAGAVADVLGELATMIVADGEGASKVARIVVRGARTQSDAERAARAVANSMLVKTAIYGADPNWGRIACALGYSGARFRAEDTVIRVGGVVVSRKGEGAGAAAEKRAHRAMLARELEIEADLGAGREESAILTCDLGVEYVKFNSEYSS